MLLPGAHMVCHVLLLETDNGLALVDSGYGLKDIADPVHRVGPVRRLTKPVLDPEETAARQIERLGFRREDVRHIVITHFDLDHIGGIADFPDAQIHVTSAEAFGAIHSPSWREKLRYRPAQWAHGPKVVEHEPGGETWHGFAAAKQLDAIDPGIVLIPLPGHTRGHACVAVDTGRGWLLHCGDAFYHHGTLDGRSRVPGVLRVQETLIAYDLRKVRENHARLAELHRRAESNVTIINAHDPHLYAKMRA
ncbi:putative metallo-hydrolase [Phytohabitans rumicis]|uniref:Putative metallo-hydrolase n=2 Tax=Phytohabitans rumicis TaxID=1076125 RepID=A0A6V8LBF3_9ACTN|nr:putative metallo-hydrolase [Phytohabitans rumicis]